MRVLRAAGVDPIQYGLLLDFLSKLSRRQEFELGSSSFSLTFAVGVLALFSGLFNLLAGLSGRPAVRSYVLANFIFIVFLLLVTLATDAINTFLNPVEGSALAHQPIRDRSYLAAKLTYLAGLVGLVVFPVSIVPALAGLNLKETWWFFPATYLISAYLWGLFLALVACAIFGFLLRVLPAARVRNIVLWLQIGLTLLFSGQYLIRPFRGVRLNLDSVYFAAVPVSWFVNIALAGQVQSARLQNWPAVLSMIGASLFIIYGVRCLSEGYLTRVHSLLRSGPGPGRIKAGWLGRAVRLATGRPSGRAAFDFMYAMARTDWQFRRAVIPMLIQFLILPLIAVVRGLGRSPFAPGPPTPAHLLPHFSGFACLMICFMLKFSDQHRAAWIFLTAPLDGIRSFVRGIFWSLWVAVAFIPVLLMPLYAWSWGITDAALFVAYSWRSGRSI
jgi:ABC-2 type transport system permease protein